MFAMNKKIITIAVLAVATTLVVMALVTPVMPAFALDIADDPDLRPPPAGGGPATPPPGGGGSTPPGSISAKISFPNPIKSESLQCLLSDILKIVVNIGAVVAVFFFIYSGFLFVTAQGNPAQITKARNAFVATVIGTTLLLGAWVLAQVIAGTISTITNPGETPRFESCD
jgi:hypothetical protein